ncbi:hypothetical protein F972_01475 [Acinetobacter sp. CIP 102529]|uniref:hypothetical protein n=1 Tax=Acinetobacter sp. CIP 102529 TaxID=1144668 RepID=UPI0002CE5650|nr:hypothetical protein [Acinetobacter sp. CIP 102529]ENU89220.1 hypothetical protein F972_01475 [Acinetobacter sp. CIP 102529]
MPNTEYPKALYKGDKKNHDFTTAFDADAENQLREDGYVDYKDLPEYEEPTETETKSDSADVKQLKKELLEALKENQELRKQIRLKELEDKPADELKAILDKAEVKYKANAGKPELAQLVLDHESNVGSDE